MNKTDISEIRFGLIVDLDKCTGCGKCAVACAQENNMPVSKNDSNQKRKAALLNILQVANDENYPNAKIAFVPKICMHCSKPTCAAVCPTGAASVKVNGTTGIAQTGCIGCRACMAACPYKTPVFIWEKPKYFDKSLNPDAPLAPKGSVVKCSLCRHLWLQARQRAAATTTKANTDSTVSHITDAAEDATSAAAAEIDTVSYTPACVAACPTDAITLCNLNNPTSKAAQLAAQAVTIPSKGDTKPNVFYLTKREWLKNILLKGIK